MFPSFSDFHLGTGLLTCHYVLVSSPGEQNQCSLFVASVKGLSDPLVLVCRGPAVPDVVTAVQQLEFPSTRAAASGHAGFSLHILRAYAWVLRHQSCNTTCRSQRVYFGLEPKWVPGISFHGLSPGGGGNFLHAALHWSYTKHIKLSVRMDLVMMWCRDVHFWWVSHHTRHVSWNTRSTHEMGMFRAY